MSTQTLLLLPGWALGSAPLEPLADALRRRLPPCYRVECIDYPALTSHRPESWVAALDHALPQDAWLAGWSLGGMLATSLAQWRGRRARGLITLGANASFVTRSGWTEAMTAESVGEFRRGLRASPARTFRRFAQLSAQGGRDTRLLGRELMTALEATPLDQALAGLGVLSALDLRDVSATLRIPQLHLFGDNDGLVPAAARHAIAARLPEGGRTASIADAGHAFPLERAEETAEFMATFILSSAHAETDP
ncbi:alpha/beta fold hydrolase [Salinicola corii]|uniref:Alpha/beta fold hydrolase n=1 Tax=Salinicola corii TaxID=2606937 RepID=A0A640W787_9GAMM|nr:alpha/beta fold hydrolase [Salinicola corii]KAA0015778.1 alpha/beta fold hydrolase [Salinicola corii]